MHFCPTRFDARIHAPARHRRYRPIEGVQGFARSHWTPSSGEYSHRIAPADDRVRIKTKNDEKAPYLPAVLPDMVVRRYNTVRIARWRGSRATTEATGRRHRASIAADRCKSDIPTPSFSEFFHRQPAEKGAPVTSRPLITIGV